MKSFEQETADTIRVLTMWCAVLSAAFLAALGVAAWGLLSARSAADSAGIVAAQVKAGLRAQTANRSANVATWCGALNRLDGELVAYVNIFVHADRGVPPLHLTNLDCAAIERNTLASTKPHQ